MTTLRNDPTSSPTTATDPTRITRSTYRQTIGALAGQGFGSSRVFFNWFTATFGGAFHFCDKSASGVAVLQV